MGSLVRTLENASAKNASSGAARRVDLEKFEAQLAEWTASIAQYRACARRAEAEARMEYEKITEELQRQRNEAGAQVLRLKASPDAHWDELKSDLDRSWKGIRIAFQKAATRF